MPDIPWLTSIRRGLAAGNTLPSRAEAWHLLAAIEYLRDDVARLRNSLELDNDTDDTLKAGTFPGGPANA